MDGDPREAIRVGTSGVITAFTGRTRAVKYLGTALKVVLTGASLAERVARTEITAEMGVH